MALEVEAKLRVASHEPVRQRLQSLGAAYIGSVVETNEIFDRSDGSLRKKGCGLRVRSFLPTQTKEPKAILTFKGPVQEGTLKSREELEVEIGAAPAMVHVLAALGFHRILLYQKRRESWKLDGCSVELDEPPHIGLFVEIEGPDESTIRMVQEKIGLKDSPHVRESYVRMVSAYCERNRITDRTVLISNNRDNTAREGP